MIANIFRISQTKEKLKKDNASTADEANDKMQEAIERNQEVIEKDLANAGGN